MTHTHEWILFPIEASGEEALLYCSVPPCPESMSRKEVVSAVNALEAELAQLRAENERLQEALHQEGHFILFTDSGWSIEHIVSCRPDMSSCEFHLLAQKEYGNGDVGIRGKYKVSIIDGNLVLEANDDAH